MKRVTVGFNAVCMLSSLQNNIIQRFPAETVILLFRFSCAGRISSLAIITCLTWRSLIIFFYHQNHSVRINVRPLYDVEGIIERSRSTTWDFMCNIISANARRTRLYAKFTSIYM